MPEDFEHPSPRSRPSLIKPPTETPGPTQQRPSTAWTSEDDEALMAARAAGLNWQPIADRYFPTKTANACRKRHERLMERRNAEDWNGIKWETLAREYMLVRREMWTILSDRLGEKSWQMIESKCMEKGLKNIQAAHRSTQRKERASIPSSGQATTASAMERGDETHDLVTASTDHGMEGDDSGLGASDAESDHADASLRRASFGSRDSVSASVVRCEAYPEQFHHYHHNHNLPPRLHPGKRKADAARAEEDEEDEDRRAGKQGKNRLSIQAMLSPSPEKAG